LKRETSKAKQITEKIISIEGIRLGRIVRIDESGLVHVDFPGNSLGPVVARITSTARAEALGKGNPAGREVLLVFENNDPHHPIIVDTLYSLIDEIVEPSSDVFDTEMPQEVTMDGKRISFDAENEIVLRCGKASITLTRAGKILIKGEYVLSHSSGENRIRGGSVSVN